MRYKIKVDDDLAYQEILSLLEGQAKVFATSPRRRLVSTGDLSSGLRNAVKEQGGRITPDRRYDLEHTV